MTDGLTDNEERTRALLEDYRPMKGHYEDAGQVVRAAEWLRGKLADGRVDEDHFTDKLLALEDICIAMDASEKAEEVRSIRRRATAYGSESTDGDGSTSAISDAPSTPPAGELTKQILVVGGFCVVAFLTAAGILAQVFYDSGLTGVAIGTLVIGAVLVVSGAVFGWQKLPDEVKNPKQVDTDAESASEEKLSETLLDPDKRLYGGLFANSAYGAHVVNSAEWLTEKYEDAYVPDSVYTQKMERLMDLAPASHEKQVERLLEDAYGTTETETEDDIPESISDKAAGEYAEEAFAQKIQEGDIAPASAIEALVQKKLRNDQGYSSVDVFRVVNQGDVAFVGAIVKQGFVGSAVKVYTLDLTQTRIIAEDSFEDLKTKRAKRQAQKKLDQIEGIQVDRSSGKSLLEVIADLEQVDKQLLVKDQNEWQSSRQGGGVIDKLISTGKKANDIGSGSWAGSPQCTQCGSQKVGKENENAYQCRECGNMMHTGLDLNLDG